MTAVCTAKVYGKGRDVSVYNCHRPQSASEDYPELCNIHAAGARKRAVNDAARAAELAVKAQKEAESKSRVQAFAALGITADLDYRSGYGSSLGGYTGGVTLSAEQADAVLAILRARS